MKKILVILMVMLTAFALADVNVTYVVNMSTLTGQGVTDSTHLVQIRGSEVGPEGVDKWYNIFLTWGDDSQNATNVGGDYWELTVAYPDSMIGWRMAYKICYMDSVNEDAYHWEDNVIGGNRMFNLPATDTTLAVAYVNTNYDPPYTPSDSVDVFFRINMSADDAFNPDNILSMVGGLPINGASSNMWSPGTYALTQEGSSAFWNIHLKFDPSLMPLTDQMYRYHNNGFEWNGHSENLNGAYFSGNENRGISLGTNDTTIAWVWWNDIPGGVFEGNDTANIVFGVNMASAIENNGFEIGDTLEVRLGYELSSPEVVTTRMTHVGGTQMYAATVNNVPLVFGDYLYYQYYLIKNGVEQREVYYNFNYDGSTVGGAERRRIIITDANPQIADVDESDASERRMPFFRNNNPLAQNVTVHVECDLRPAYAAVAAGKVLDDIQGTQDISSISQINGVAINGPLSNFAEGTWASWGSSLMNDTNRVMFDDGTHGDATAGDTIYTITYFLSPDSGHVVGQECKFGINGGDNESGEGGYGNNHIVNVDDSQAESYLYIAFGSINPVYYSDWTYTPGVAVSDVVPANYKLAQNYPNPFNPVTTISYQLAETGGVQLIVYDMSGRRIRTLVNEYANAGSYKVSFDASDLASGVYFYQLNAGNTVITKKMVLMK
ncbi:MAG: T9SS type A sorting domain-containing protein [Candidatus Neomarinimicrobiota bacterium]|nr:T9SS type A sorting domain-containing protein [Candidatus Neomarinimicrobiota bacterium]MDX9780505.1 T9SS type A sorting domain-containing protein [bacterium]